MWEVYVDGSLVAGFETLEAAQEEATRIKNDNGELSVRIFDEEGEPWDAAGRQRR